MHFSEPQLNFLRRATRGTHLSYGSVRSGKTFVQLYAFIAFLIGDESKPGVDCLMTAKKRDAITRNMFGPLKEILDGEKELEPHFEFKTQPFRVIFKPKGIMCYCEGANDDQAALKIRGMTIQAWVGDEVNLYPRSFWNECFNRLSAGNRLALLTCNPDMLTHYIYKDYIAPNRISHYRFLLTDNHTLNPEYIETIKQNFTGMQYTRLIEGKWGGNEDDMVLPEFITMRDQIVCQYDLPEHFHPMVAMDVGWKDFTFACLGHYDFVSDTLYIDNEFVIKKNMTTDMLAKGLVNCELDTWGRAARRRWSDIDLRLIEDLNRLHGISMIPTRKDNKDAAINALRVRIRDGRLKIHERCEELINQLASATWDKNRQERTYSRSEDHGHFDGVDALLYFNRNIDKSNPYPDQSMGWIASGKTISPKYRKERGQEWDSLRPKIQHPMDGGSALRGQMGWLNR